MLNAAEVRQSYRVWQWCTGSITTTTISELASTSLALPSTTSSTAHTSTLIPFFSLVLFGHFSSSSTSTTTTTTSALMSTHWHLPTNSLSARSHNCSSSQHFSKCHRTASNLLLLLLLLICIEHSSLPSPSAVVISSSTRHLGGQLVTAAANTAAPDIVTHCDP